MDILKTLVYILLFVSMGMCGQNLRLDKDTVFQETNGKELVIDTLRLNNQKMWIKSTDEQKLPTKMKVNVILGPGTMFVDENAQLLVKKVPESNVKVWMSNIKFIDEKLESKI
jgi:hypothetical protein